MADYDKFMTIYGGCKWQYDRAENLKDFMDYTHTPQADRDFMANLKPILEFKRNGDSIDQFYEFMPGMVLNFSWKFGEEYETADEAEPKKWHNKGVPALEGDKYKQVVKSFLPAPRDTTHIAYGFVENGELVFDIKKEDGGYLCKTWYKKI